MSQEKKIWFVGFPTHQYNEDVQALAKEHGLCILDARFDDGTGTENPPELTLKNESAEPEQSEGSEVDSDTQPPETTEAEDDTDAVEPTEAEKLTADNHALMIEWFGESNITSKPLVKAVEGALDMDTDGKAIDAAWEEFKAA